jgi:hypothetical protein
MKIVRLSKDSNLTRIEKKFNWFRFSGRGPEGEKGDTGEGVASGGTTGQHLAKKSNTDFDTEWVDPSAGINYGSPIAVNTSQTITPSDGDYFTSTSKLVALTGTSGEVFEPAESGETTRKIWGNGAGISSMTLTINTSSLAIGDIFAVELDNGESRVLMLNSAGDLVKEGGVEIHMSFEAEGSSDQTGLPSSTYQDVDLDTEISDNGRVFNPATFTFSPKRTAFWNFGGAGAAFPSVSLALTRSLCRIRVGGVNNKVFNDFRPNDKAGGSVIVSNGWPRKFTEAEAITLAVFTIVSSGTWSIQGSNCKLEGVEVVPW